MIEETENTTANRKDADKKRKAELSMAISEVLASKSGRVVLAAILAKCQTEGINGHDGAAAFRTEGARTVGLLIQKMLSEHDFEGFMKLYREIHLP